MTFVQYAFALGSLYIISTSSAFQYTGLGPNTRIPLARVTPLFAIKVEKTDEEWKEILAPDQFNVLRREGTEPPWTSPLNEVKEDGTFRCAGCKSALFRTSTKYESGSGWPSFYSPIDDEAIDLSVDYKLVIPRTEVTCKSCGGHLGHVFDDGPQPTGKRYCMNGVAMDFISDTDDPALAKESAERIATARKIKQPIMAVLPGLGFDAALAVLFITSFISKNGSGGLTLLTNGLSLGQVWDLFPLGFGVYYAASALQKSVDLMRSSEE